MVVVDVVGLSFVKSSGWFADALRSHEEIYAEDKKHTKKYTMITWLHFDVRNNYAHIIEY